MIKKTIIIGLVLITYPFGQDISTLLKVAGQYISISLVKTLLSCIGS